MPETVVALGSLPEIIRNENNLYDGDLRFYFRVISKYAQNLQHPYHNFRHMLHVMWLCYQACCFYHVDLHVDMTHRRMRNLLIAALFHDVDHSGLKGEDDLNIERAIRFFQKHILPEDRPYGRSIIELIRATQYPYVIPSVVLSLEGLIIRDADMAQVFSAAWMMSRKVRLGSTSAMSNSS